MDDGAPLLEELPVRLHAVGQRVVLVVQELDAAISKRQPTVVSPGPLFFEVVKRSAHLMTATSEALARSCCCTFLFFARLAT